MGMEITFCWTCHLSKIWAADQPYFQAVPGPLVPQAEWLIRIMPSTTRGVQRAGSSHLQAVCLAVGNQLVLSKIGVAFHFLDSWAHRGHTEQIVNLLTAEAGQSQCLHQPISHQSLQSLSHFLVVNGSIVDSPISILRKRSSPHSKASGTGPNTPVGGQPASSRGQAPHLHSGSQYSIARKSQTVPPEAPPCQVQCSPSEPPQCQSHCGRQQSSQCSGSVYSGHT